MITIECSVHRDLAAFVDGELRGAAVLDVLQHLERCSDCAAEVASLRAIGDRMRALLPAESVPAELEGLASTIISRTRAESAESWPGMFRRAQEDWHWVIVGVGAIAATFVSTLTLSAILAFGPKPDRADSISAFYTNFRTPAGDLYLLATPAGRDQQEPVWVNENGGPAPVVHATWFATRARAEAARAEADLVGALQDAVTVQGHTVALNQMTPKRRRLTESLLVEISRYRTTAPIPQGSPLKVHQVRLEASASVTAKGL
jgi:hypothetical protein